LVELPTGEALTEDQASEVTRANQACVVLLAGPVASGKTTIVTSLFEAFLEAPFGNYLFAGSRTLVGFERRCHDARVTSGRRVPHTTRTPIASGVEFLHLRLTSSGRHDIGAQDLLLSDVSGEKIRALRDSTSAVKQMTMLRRADHICIILDGATLADSKLRHSARAGAKTLLRALVEAGVLSPHCQVDIVLTKWDVVVTHPGRNEIEAFVLETKASLSALKTNLPALAYFEVAARPESKTVPFAHGLPTLLRRWLGAPQIRQQARLYMPIETGSAREMSRFAAGVIDRQRLGESYDIQWV